MNFIPFPTLIIILSVALRKFFEWIYENIKKTYESIKSTLRKPKVSVFFLSYYIENGEKI